MCMKSRERETKKYRMREKVSGKEIEGKIVRERKREREIETETESEREKDGQRVRETEREKKARERKIDKGLRVKEK